LRDRVPTRPPGWRDTLQTTRFFDFGLFSVMPGQAGTQYTAQLYMPSQTLVQKS